MSVLRSGPAVNGDVRPMQIQLYGQVDSSTSALDESTGDAVNLSSAVILGNDSSTSAISAGQVGMEWEDDHGNQNYAQNNMMRVNVDADQN